MLLGYARVSIQDQDTTAQIVALRTAGCELIFQEKAVGGVRADKSGLTVLIFTIPIGKSEMVLTRRVYIDYQNKQRQLRSTGA